MQTEFNTLLNEQQIADFEITIGDQLAEFIAAEKLDKTFIDAFKSVYLPLAKWVEVKHKSDPIIIGINGAQGSGKSTLCKLLALLLNRLFNKRVLHLSIDDLYLSREKRQQLAISVHPLLNVRGVPGTHNVEQGIGLFERIKTGSSAPMKYPVFDKSIDDCLPKEQWPSLPKNIDIVLFEGWCVGAAPQAEAALKKPINVLESLADADASWRTYVNQQLADKYKPLFSYIDHLIMLKVPNMESVYEWRNLQENKLRDNYENAEHIMSPKQIKEFIMYFERLTRHCLSEMPERADVVLSLNKAHQVTCVGTK